MKKTLAFGDAHKAGKDAYKALLDEAMRQGVKQAVFLGDMDYTSNVRQFLAFSDFARRAKIPVYAVRGNHDQALLDYATGAEQRIVTARHSDTAIFNDAAVQSHLRGLPEDVTIDDVVFRHALPRGRVRSGPMGRSLKRKSQGNLGDHRVAHRELWHYSFNTYDGNGMRCPHVGSGMESYDPEIVRWNFDDMDQNGQDFMVKGHEHFPKVWRSDIPLDASNGRILDPSRQGTTYLSAPAIIQVGDFGNGHYALLEYDGRTMAVQFRKL